MRFWCRLSVGGPVTVTPGSGPGTGHPAETVGDRVRAVLGARPDDEIYRFLDDGEGEPSRLPNAELDRRARALAGVLADRFPARERAVIVCPPGLDYVTSFLACLYAGLVAVPVYPPNPALLQRTLPRLLGVIRDARPAAILAPAAVVSMSAALAELAPAIGGLTWVAVDEVDPAAADSWQRPAVTAADTAFLQYTSGSTGTPKGVVVSHANLLHNLEAIHQLFVRDDPPADSHLVCWLPPYHDMGLIGGLLEPLYGGFPVTLMPPLAFLKQPIRWLRAISAHGATYTGGPDFAYELCVSRSTEADRAGLDLSGLRLAFTGAEPVRAETLDRFCAAYEPYGFRREAFYPCYGLAEGTLIVSGGERAARPVVRRLDPAALATGTAVPAGAGGPARTAVGCGTAIPGQQLQVVDPDTGSPVPDGQVGEIWAAGPSVAGGYWDRPAESAEVFTTRPATGGRWLRTGDLGFLDGGELYVTGRRKDLLIVAGRNHYPQDIERTVEAVDPAVRPGCCVAAGLDVGGEERLLVVAEVNHRRLAADPGPLLAAIRTAVATEHDLPVHRIALVRRGAVPKTSSGKLQRAKCRAAVLDGSLEPVAGWTAGDPEPTPAAPAPAAPAPTAPAAASGPTGPAPAPAGNGTVPRHRVERWLTEAVAERAGVPAATVDPTRPLASYGLGSVDLVGLAGAAERELGRPLPATLAWEHPTIGAIADFVVGGSGSAAAAPPSERTGTAEPVAVIGVGCRFPGGADGPDAFWRLLCDGRDTITEVPADRWPVEDYLTDDPATPGRTTTRWGGFLDRVDGFDPHFFGISGHEAARMDPQQRLLAEIAWEALEDAGLPADRLAGSPTGVFVGIATNDYGMRFGDLNRIDAYTGTGNALSIAANRLSYLLDLRGPSLAVDTACSSSLVAVHLAVRSLAAGDCTLALAGGVNVVLSPALAINFSKAGAMAADGRCKAFDARADGYVRAEGAGMVVLKPLSRALADGDPVYAVIRGAAVNSDGRTNGLMAPNRQAQEAVLRAAYADAGIRPEQVDYVEAHGTGTLLGDPIEAGALAAVVAADRPADRPVLVGSVKTNLGHLEAAAGIAGLIKAVLMVRHRAVPPSLHFERPNPHIPFAELKLRVAAAAGPWPSTGTPARAGVSSFGFGGTNAHVVIEEAPAPAPSAARAGVPLLVLSARSPEALGELAGRYEAHLARVPDSAVDGLCRAAAVRRTHHDHRLACVGRSATELRDALAAYGRGDERPGLSAGPRRVGRRPAVAFVFPGQGPRWWPLGADLLATEPVFRGVLERADALLLPEGWSLLEELTAGPDAARLADPAVAQPALCAVQVALAELWRSWGVEPAAVVGHSVGEVAAAHVAGALDLADALRVATHRGRVIRAALGHGRMAVAAVPAERAERLLGELGLAAVGVAASNGPQATVLSGERTELERVVAALAAEGAFARLLESVDYASHGPQMEPLQDELRSALTGLRPAPPAVPMISTVTGAAVAGPALDAGYWAANLRRPVLFDQAVTALVETGHDTFVEVSPHPMLTDAVADRLAAQEVSGVAVGSLRRDTPARRAVLGELGRLHTAGFPVDWTRLHGPAPMVPLPAYPWQRERCWLDDGPVRRRPAGGHPVLQDEVRSAVEPRAHHWTGRVDLTELPYLRDHEVGGAPVLPASLLLDAALAGAGRVAGAGAVELTDVHLTRMTVPPEAAAEPTVQLVVQPETATTGSFRLFTATGTDAVDAAGPDWQQVADGRFRAGDPADGPGAAGETLAEVRDRCREAVPVDGLYGTLAEAGLRYGPAFRRIMELHRGDREAVGRLDDAPAPGGTGHLVDPAVLDGCLQVLAAAVDPADPDRTTRLPVGFGRFRLAAGAGAPRWAHAVLPRGDLGRDVEGARVVLHDDAGRWVGELDGIVLRGLDTQGSDPVADSLLELRWREVAAPDAAAASPAGRWLLLADRGGVVEDLRSALTGRGIDAVTATAGRRWRRTGADRYELDPARPGDVAALLTGLGDEPLAGVVHAWSLDAMLPEDGGDGADDRLWRAYDLAAVSALHVVQALAARGGPPTRLVLATRGAQRVGGGADGAGAPGQAALWGLARVAAVEHAELRPTMVDLDPAGDAAADLLDVLLRPGDQRQLAVRGGRRYAPGLAPWQPPTAAGGWPRRPADPDRDANCRILAEQPGILDSLTVTSWRRVPPGPGEVEVEVAAAGLNFADVLKALDSCPGVPPGITPLGAECAGRVTAVGPGVEGLRRGDRVVAVAPSSLARFVTTPAYLVAPAPAGLSDEEAAAVPIAYLTAIYGLRHLARLGPGETVLVHAATGGVGLAALQVARSCGATVIATAGSDAKRELLRGLGVAHVLDSRTLRFADQVRELTGGRGVDVVLNSLPGEALTRGLALLAPGGRFVEIGKQDVYAGSHVDLGLLRHNRSFFAVDLESAFAAEPALIATLYAELTRGFAAGDYDRLPVTGYPFSAAPAAFALMAQARHTGKIVLRPDGGEIAVRPGELPVRATATYLVTGGLGALGRQTAGHLVAAGARHLVLVGRRPPTGAAAAAVDALRAAGAEVRVAVADVARRADVDRVLADIDATLPPLAGVVHAAGVLDDGLLGQLDRDRFHAVAAAKVAGGWHLHLATLDRDLDFFVLYSSAAALLGSPGQGNYAAANAFLDGLAQHRRGAGRPALSIDWGPWSEAGLAARPDRAGALAGRGILGVTPEHGVEALDRLLRTPADHVCVLPRDPARLRAAAATGLLPDLLTGLLDPADRPADAAPTGEVRSGLLAVEPGRRRRALLVRHCAAEAARVLKVDESTVDTSVPLAGQGFDSLMALELRRRLERSLELELPATVAFRFPTVEAMVPYLAERMGVELEAAAPEPVRVPAPAGPAAPADPDTGLATGLATDLDTGLDTDPDAGLDEIPDAEIEALLLAKMAQLDEGR